VEHCSHPYTVVNDAGWRMELVGLCDLRLFSCVAQFLVIAAAADDDVDSPPFRRERGGGTIVDSHVE